MIGCLRTRVRKQPIIALYFESELVLKFYNLKARAEDANHYQVQKVGISCFYLYSCIFVFIIRNDSSSAILRKPRNDKIYYTIIDFNEVDIRIYLPEKVIIHRGR